MTSNASVRRASWLVIAGAVIHLAAGVVGQIVRASTDVSDDLFRYPWTESAFVVLSLVAAGSFALLLAGFAGLRAAGAPTPGARTGFTIAIVALALFVVGELASIPVRSDDVDAGGAGLVGTLFGLATILLGVGLATAGRATLRDGALPGWRRYALLATGVWTLALIGIVLTSVMQAGLAVFGALLVAVGVSVLSTNPTGADAARGSSIALP